MDCERQALTPKGEHLFPELNKSRYGEARRLRPLFLPALLEKEARDKRLKSPDQDHAYEIICKWADIESSGKLGLCGHQNIHLSTLANGLPYIASSIDIAMP
jgi:hypothetical protein